MIFAEINLGKTLEILSLKTGKFLDDCETLLEENKINPNDLLSILNSINLSIQFTMKLSKYAIPFLDILNKRNNDKIWMDILQTNLSS